jgi:NADH-ubiquinone oxidoreductase chain 1
LAELNAIDLGFIYILKVYLVIMNFVFFLIFLVGILVRVAFIILLERKLLSYIQLRKGPNKVGWWGVIQSFSDAVKLFIKEQFFPLKSNKLIYLFAPIFSLFFVLLMWLSFPLTYNLINWKFRALFFFCSRSMGVYILMGTGWSSNSNYSLIGALRGVAQTVSYEVRIILIFLFFLVYKSHFRLIKIYRYQWYFSIIFIFFPLFIMWFLSSLAETNRTPFDFSEGESELVSGFNIEYGGGGFALLFLAEYARIIFIRFLITVLFFSLNSFYLIYAFSIFWVYSFIWVRSCYPRFRYDKLIDMSWKIFLPLVLLLIIFYTIYI